MITTNNKKFYQKIIKLRNLGQKRKNIHDEIGVNSRLDSIQASLLNLKLKSLNKFNLKRKNIANFYKKNIKNDKINIIKYSKNAVYHQYVILVKNRKGLIKHLEKNQIQYGIHYPNPINKLKCFNKLFKKQKLVNSEYIASRCLSLPIDPILKKSEINKVIKVLNSF